MKSTPVNPENICPSCYRKLDMANDPEEKFVPKKGDLTVCIYCQEVLEFTDDLNIKKLSEETYNKLSNDVKLKLKLYQQTAKKIITENKLNHENT